jgi:hypothetical protein
MILSIVTVKVVPINVKPVKEIWIIVPNVADQIELLKFQIVSANLISSITDLQIVSHVKDSVWVAKIK